MKKALLFLLLPLVIACSNDSKDPILEYVNFDTNQIIQESEESTRHTFKVKSNTYWTIEGEYEWCTWVWGVMSGRGNQSFTLELPSGLYIDNDREAKFIIRNNKETVSDTLVIQQKAIRRITNVSRDIIAKQKGGEYEISFTANLPINISIPESDKSWISINNQVKAADKNYKYAITVAENLGGKRIGEIFLIGDEQTSKYITITQDAFIQLESIKLPENAIEAYSEKFIYLDLAFTPEDASNKEVVWESSDKSIAEVDESGKLHIKGKIGTCTIKVVNTYSGLSDLCTVTCLPKANK